MAAFTEVFEDVTKQGRKIPTTEYLETGMYPIIDQGKTKIAGYTNESEGLFSDVPVIIFGDHTRVLKYVDTPCFLGADGVKLLKAKIESSNTKYLFYALSSANIPNTGYNRHFKWLKEVEIPLPSIEKQAHIVTVLDKVNELILLREQQLAKLDELVKARFVELFGVCKSTMAVNDVCLIITDGTHQPPKFQHKGIPFILVSNIAGNKVTYETEKYISEETYEELVKRTPIEIGDVLLSTVGSYGHPAVVLEERKFLFQRHIAYLKPDRNLINSQYLHSALLAPDAQRQIEEKVKGIAQKTLNLSEIRKIIIPVPGMDLQNAFADFVKRVDKSKLAIQKGLDKLEVLKKELMQKYFG